MRSGMPGERVGVFWRRRRTALSLLWVICLSACGGHQAGPLADGTAAVLWGVGFLAGDASSELAAVSGDGQVAVGSSQAADGRRRAFRWSRVEGLTALGQVDGGQTSSALAASFDGSVIAGQASAPGSSSVAFRWTPSTGMQALPGLQGATLCVAMGVSGDGSVVVGTCLLAGNAGFRWTQTSGMTSLGQFGGGTSRASNAMAISRDGATIVGAGHPVLTGAVWWDAAGQVTVLGHLQNDVAAVATAVARDGATIVGYSSDGLARERAFRWTLATGMTLLGSGQEGLGDVVATGVSGNGQVMVGWATSPVGEVALIWTEGSGLSRLEELIRARFQLDMKGWMLTRATGISDDGLTIVGQGLNPQGQLEGWVLKLAEAWP